MEDPTVFWVMLDWDYQREVGVDIGEGGLVRREIYGEGDPSEEPIVKRVNFRSNTWEDTRVSWTHIG